MNLMRLNICIFFLIYLFTSFTKVTSQIGIESKKESYVTKDTIIKEYKEIDKRNEQEIKNKVKELVAMQPKVVYKTRYIVKQKIVHITDTVYLDKEELAIEDRNKLNNDYENGSPPKKDTVYIKVYEKDDRTLVQRIFNKHKIN